MANFRAVTAFSESNKRIDNFVDGCLTPLGLREKPWASEPAFFVGVIYEARGYKINRSCMVTQSLDKVILVSLIALAIISTYGLGIPRQYLGGAVVGLGALSLGANLLIGNLKERKFELFVGFLKTLALATVGGLAVGGILHPAVLGYSVLGISSAAFSITALITAGIACNKLCCRKNQ